MHAAAHTPTACQFSNAFRGIALAALTLSLCASERAFAQTPVTVVEYFNPSINAYFLTGRADEQTTLNARFDFQRTGMSFVTASAASVAGSGGSGSAGSATDSLDAVCRYRVQITGSSFTSHFYGLSADCAQIAAAKLPNFFSEGIDFAVTKPVNGTCSGSAPVPVYRALRSLSPVDTPNHRYAVSGGIYQDMLKQGWTGEGVVFCAQSATNPTPRPLLTSSSTNEDRCALPRKGIRAYTGLPYPDQQGSLANELAWVQSFSDETYLWYRELPNLNPTKLADYGDTRTLFNTLITPGLALSGRPKDQFHFLLATADLDEQRAGVDSGYGITWAFINTGVPRKLLVKYVEPGSPADAAGLRRGASIVSVDGVSLATGNASVLNAGLFATKIGETHRFEWLDAASTAPRSASLTTAAIVAQPVLNSGSITTATGRVGYIALTTFLVDTAESALANAVAGLQAQGVTDLVLDLRYNGGGYTDISAELAFMVAGPARTAGKVFEKFKFNDKLPTGFGTSAADIRTPFYDKAPGDFSLAKDTPLPTLNLGRVYVLTSGNTASASEGLINGLRGAGVEVVLIGSTTRGKPYGFYVVDNCGLTYLTIQFSGVNEIGGGDYVDGFAPTCAASDDLSKQLGDPAEGQLASALAYRATGLCAPASSEAKSALPLNLGADAITVPASLALPGRLLTERGHRSSGNGSGSNKGRALVVPREATELTSSAP
jgi:carboxyl-terminal processing protease